MFENKNFADLKRTYLKIKSERCYNAKSALYYFLYEDKYIVRFSYLTYDLNRVRKQNKTIHTLPIDRLFRN